MSEIRYTKDHEWIKAEGQTATVGITEYAADQLGDVVFVELPEVGKSFNKGDEIAVVESVKAASEVYAPVSGKVVEINDVLEGEPAKVNEAPQGEGWFFKLELSDPGELEDLMDADAYQKHTE